MANLVDLICNVTYNLDKTDGSESDNSISWKIGRSNTGVNHIVLPQYVPFHKDPTKIVALRNEMLRDSGAGAISREHCAISRIEGGYYLTDSGSSYGTYVNGTKIHKGVPFKLSNGDIICLGNSGYELQFKE